MEKKRLFEDDWKQPNDESKVAKMQLKNMQANIQELLNKIDSTEELDSWVQSYLTKADDYLDSVKKYVVFGQDEEETTVIEPTPVNEPMTNVPGSTPAPAPGKPLMPSLADFDPDAEEPEGESPMDLIGKGGPEELGEPGELPAGEELPEEPIEEPDIEGEEIEDDEMGDEIEGEEIEDEEIEDDEMGDEMEDEGPEEVIEEPEELDLDDDQFEMPSIGDFDVEDGEAIPSGMESLPKPQPEDEVTYDDIEFFNGPDDEEGEEIK